MPVGDHSVPGSEDCGGDKACGFPQGPRWPGRGDRIKLLLWDGTGLVMAYKRLEEGKFSWPGISDGVMRLSKGQFEALFEGLDWRRVLARRVRRPGAAE